jgi:hypothetical protein
MRDKAPASRCKVLHFDALRLIALRKEGMTGEHSQQATKEKGLYAHLRMYNQVILLFAAGA